MLERLRSVYRSAGITVRFYPKSLTSWRWQAGTGGDGKQQQFELVAYARSATELVDAIAAWAKEQARNGH